jgi:hypothetical protein
VIYIKEELYFLRNFSTTKDDDLAFVRANLLGSNSSQRGGKIIG